MFKLMLIAGAGGFVGTCCRYLTNQCFLSYWKQNLLPLATFTVNIIGCLIMGLILGTIQKHNLIDPRINAAIIVGFCGGFTTFSTFSFESLYMGQQMGFLYPVIYIICSVVVGVLAMALGLLLTR